MDDGGRSLPSTIFLCDPLARSPPAPPSPARSTALSPVAAGDPRSTSANPTVPPFPPSRPSSSTRMKRESASRTSRASSGPRNSVDLVHNLGTVGAKVLGNSSPRQILLEDHQVARQPAVVIVKGVCKTKLSHVNRFPHEKVCTPFS